jgi:4-amino-4-deoxy-L-arabinose transferase-like glycosyltransferase
MKFKKKISIIIIILLTIVIRIPSFPHEQGMDSFYIHSLSSDIKADGYSKWIASPISIIGWYPYSYPSGTPYLLSIISLVSDINLEKTILLFSTIIAIIGTIAVYSLTKIITKKENTAIIAMLLFSISPLMITFTTWTISARALLVILIPIIIMLLLKYKYLKKNKYLITLLIITLLSATIHRMFILILIGIIPAIILYQLIFIITKKRPSIKKYLIYILGIMFLLFFIIQFLNIEPYKTYAWTYRTGEFFTAGTVTEYFNGKLNPFILGINMLIDYGTNIGIGAIFILIAAAYLIKKIIIKTYSDTELLLICLMLLAIPFLINGYYTAFFYLPIFCILSSIGITTIIEYKKINKTYKKILIILIIIVSICFSIFINIHNINLFPKEIENPWLLKSTIQTSIFMTKELPENNAILISNSLTVNRMKSLTHNKIIPTNNINDIWMLTYDLLNTYDIRTKVNISTASLTTKKIAKITEIQINSQQDWELLISTTSNNPKNKKIKKYYDLNYIIENSKFFNTNLRWKYYAEVKETENKIYNNKKQEIWDVR